MQFPALLNDTVRSCCCYQSTMDDNHLQVQRQQSSALVNSKYSYEFLCRRCQFYLCIATPTNGKLDCTASSSHLEIPFSTKSARMRGAYEHGAIQRRSFASFGGTSTERRSLDGVGSRCLVSSSSLSLSSMIGECIEYNSSSE